MNFLAAFRGLRRFGTGPRALILMYHRVASGFADPWQLCVSAENFRAHLQVLRKNFRPVPLQAVTGVRAIYPRSIAVTFDDGYADNLLTAAPLLERFAIPATFFVTSGMIGTGREFWWDELERLLLQNPALPDVLHFANGSSGKSFRSNGAETYRIPAPGAPHTAPWEAPAGTRLHFYYEVWSWLRTLDAPEREATLNTLRLQLRSEGHARDSHRTLTVDEVKRLAEMPGIEVGAHSVTHAALSQCAPSEQRREMEESKRTLTEWIARDVSGFAYPFGDHSVQTAQQARAAGFRYAVTTESGPVTTRSNAHTLPRIAVPDCDGPVFRRMLESML